MCVLQLANVAFDVLETNRNEMDTDTVAEDFEKEGMINTNIFYM
jgi:hypothetical protein